MTNDKKEKEKDAQSTQLVLADEFDKTWSITSKGSVQCTPATRAKASAWVDKHHFMVSLLTGVDLEPLVFEDPTGNPEAAKRNRLKMLYYYSITHTAYVIFCQRLKREQLSKFKDNVSECVEDEDEPEVD
jgi:hypothetical protein